MGHGPLQVIFHMNINDIQSRNLTKSLLPTKEQSLHKLYMTFSDTLPIAIPIIYGALPVWLIIVLIQ